jgi:hypothetical protein
MAFWCLARSSFLWRGVSFFSLLFFDVPIWLLFGGSISFVGMLDDDGKGEEERMGREEERRRGEEERSRGLEDEDEEIMRDGRTGKEMKKGQSTYCNCPGAAL